MFCGRGGVATLFFLISTQSTDAGRNTGDVKRCGSLGELYDTKKEGKSDFMMVNCYSVLLSQEGSFPTFERLRFKIILSKRR